jgi:uncharacterized protein YdeI (YjbR/CyaY-like superfamily)
VELFASPADWRAWLEQHHASATELVVGFWKTGTGKACMTWSESVDEALCFGWIDAVRRRVDEDSYSIRFTRRKVATHWVTSAKRAETWDKRLAELVADCAAGLRIRSQRR